MVPPGTTATTAGNRVDARVGSAKQAGTYRIARARRFALAGLLLEPSALEPYKSREP